MGVLVGGEHEQMISQPGKHEIFIKKRYSSLPPRPFDQRIIALFRCCFGGIEKGLLS
jgi:hypothetical protein